MARLQHAPVFLLFLLVVPLTAAEGSSFASPTTPTTTSKPPIGASIVAPPSPTASCVDLANCGTGGPVLCSQPFVDMCQMTCGLCQVSECVDIVNCSDTYNKMICDEPETAVLCKKTCGLCATATATPPLVTPSSSIKTTGSSATTLQSLNTTVSTPIMITVQDPCHDIVPEGCTSVLDQAHFQRICNDQHMALFCNKSCGLCTASTLVMTSTTSSHSPVVTLPVSIPISSTSESSTTATTTTTASCVDLTYCGTGGPDICSKPFVDFCQKTCGLCQVSECVDIVNCSDTYNKMTCDEPETAVFCKKTCGLCSIATATPPLVTPSSSRKTTGSSATTLQSLNTTVSTPVMTTVQAASTIVMTSTTSSHSPVVTSTVSIPISSTSESTTTATTTTTEADKPVLSIGF